MMKKYLFLSALIISICSCESDKDNSSIIPLNSKNLPGKYIDAMTIDSKGAVWFSTSEIGDMSSMPPYSSSLPIKGYLTKYFDGSYLIYADKFIGAKQMVVDKNDKLWYITGKTLYTFDDQGPVEYYSLPTDKGSFNWITTDKENNIWIGGLKTPLIKITNDQKINITEIVENLSSTAAHFDINNNLWIALWDNWIGKRNPSGDWTYYSPNNAALPNQNFWSITSDKDNNIWAGTGWMDNSVNLIRFNGNNWEKIIPKDDLGNQIYGTVRQLYSGGNKIWIVSEVSVNSAFDRSYLITFDGNKWDRIYDAPLKDGISGIELDLNQNKAFIATKNNGCIVVSIK